MQRPRFHLRLALPILTACLFLAVAVGPCLEAAEVQVLLSSDKAPYLQAVDGLRAPLTAQGHAIVVRKLEEPGAPALADNAACVIAVGTQAALWLRDHPPAKAPALYCMVADPETSGLGKMRGITTDVPLASQLVLIGETLPAVRLIGALYRGDQERGRRQIDELKRTLPAEWRLVAIPVEQHPGPSDAIDALFAQNIDLVWTTPDAGVYSEAVVRTLLLTALRRRVPVFGFSHAFVRAGGLFGVGINPTTQGAQAAGLVQRLLSAPASLDQEPLCAPPAFEIAVNLVVAQKLSIELPKELIRRAAQTFQPGR